jgi:hypothetical protein
MESNFFLIKMYLQSLEIDTLQYEDEAHYQQEMEKTRQLFIDSQRLSPLQEKVLYRGLEIITFVSVTWLISKINEVFSHLRHASEEEGPLQFDKYRKMEQILFGNTIKENSQKGDYRAILKLITQLFSEIIISYDEEGRSVPDLRNGDGMKLYGNGIVEKGHFQDYKISGIGKKIILDRWEYNGNFEEGKLHGKGERRFANGDLENGNFKEDKFHGKGEKRFANGNFENGNFKEGKLHGKGERRFANGDFEEGEYSNGHLHKGKKVLANGIKEDGYFLYQCIFKRVFANGDYE